MAHHMNLILWRHAEAEDTAPDTRPMTHYHYAQSAPFA